MRFLMIDLFLICIFALAPLPLDRPKEKGIVALIGPTNWGQLIVKGKEVTLGGHDCWDATGSLLPNGKIHLIWILRSDNKIGHGVYDFKDGALEGLWGWESGVEVSEDGVITGSVNHDKIYKISP